MLWLIPLTVMPVMFGAGIGLILGILNVFTRDIGQVTPIILQLLFWMTPIIYPMDIVPQVFRQWLDFSPLYMMTHGYQQVLVYGMNPDWEKTVTVIVSGISLAFLSLFMFRKSNSEMVDHL